MISSVRSSSVATGLASAILLSMLGCASYGKRLTPQQFESLAPLHVVCIREPGLKVWTAEAFAFGSAAGMLLSPAFGPNLMLSLTKSQDTAQLGFGGLVAAKFIARAKGEIPGWPAVIVEQGPVPDPYLHRSRTSLEFRVTEMKLVEYLGLTCIVEAQIKTLGSPPFWGRRFGFKSRGNNRTQRLASWQADDYRLLKEELQTAADSIADGFISSLK